MRLSLLNGIAYRMKVFSYKQMSKPHVLPKRGVRMFKVGKFQLLRFVILNILGEYMTKEEKSVSM